MTYGYKHIRLIYQMVKWKSGGSIEFQWYTCFINIDINIDIFRTEKLYEGLNLGIPASVWSDSDFECHTRQILVKGLERSIWFGPFLIFVWKPNRHKCALVKIFIFTLNQQVLHFNCRLAIRMAERYYREINNYNSHITNGKNLPYQNKRPTKTLQNAENERRRSSSDQNGYWIRKWEWYIQRAAIKEIE